MKTVSRFNRLMPALVIVAIAVPFLALAITPVPTITPTEAQKSLVKVVENILAISRVLILVVFVLAIVAFGWGIVQFIFAGGDPAGIAKAKSFLLWGVIGMAVMASLFGLISFLKDYFGVGGGVGDALNINAPEIQNIP